MNTSTKIISITFILLVSLLQPMKAQNKTSLRVNAGIASGVKFVDGYYFSFDVGIPIVKSLELAPTFSCASMLPNTIIYNSWHETSESPMYGYPLEGPRQEQEYGDILSSVSLLVLFKPFELINKDAFAKHELIIGAGYGFKTYISVSSQYDLSNDKPEIVGFSYKSNVGFEPYYFKLAYNYLYTDNKFVGLSFGLDGFDGEAELLAGIQFGVKL